MPASHFSFEYHNAKQVPEGLLVLHICDNPSCVNPKHLFIGTSYQNTHDCISKGRFVDNRGEKQGSSRLAEADVLEIRRLFALGGLSNAAIGRKFGITAGHVSEIGHRKRWAHLL